VQRDTFLRVLLRSLFVFFNEMDKETVVQRAVMGVDDRVKCKSGEGNNSAQ